MDKIKIKNKYILFKLNTDNNKINIITKTNTKIELKEKTKGKRLNISDDILLMKFEKKNWTPLTKTPINMLGGPIKITFSFLIMIFLKLNLVEKKNRWLLFILQKI